MISTTFRYSLISQVELTREALILQTRQIATQFELSPHYLSVVLRELRRLGLVESVKGNRGGPGSGGGVAGGSVHRARIRNPGR